MSDLAVPAALRDLAELVESVRTRMNATGKNFEGYEDDVGDSSVKSALESFVDNWKDGRKEIDGQLTGIKEIAEMVVDGFDALQEELSAELEGDGEGGGDGQAQ